MNNIESRIIEIQEQLDICYNKYVKEYDLSEFDSVSTADLDFYVITNKCHGVDCGIYADLHAERITAINNTQAINK